MPRIFRDHKSCNFGPRKAVDGNVGVRHLLIHYTGMKSADEALARLCAEDSGVSAHYMIDEDGKTFALVDESARAWHAGVGFWAGTRDLNSTSIGIELVNPGHEYGYRPFPAAQIDALRELAGGIIERHALAPTAVLGHSDIAPSRKQDPGELFPWADLAQSRFGIWPTETGVSLSSPAAVWNALSAIGYAIPNGPGADILDPATAAEDVITAFQRRFRPARVDGVLDPETSARIAAVAEHYVLAGRVA
jgi:N-acetylmuramoyl-L-alanine amidase